VSRRNVAVVQSYESELNRLYTAEMARDWMLDVSKTAEPAAMRALSSTNWPSVDSDVLALVLDDLTRNL
jgi:hypothetical protein